MKKIHIHCVQHVPYEGLGCIRTWMENHQFPFTLTQCYCGDPFPDLAKIDWIIILGGPMGVGDTLQYPWLIVEKEFI
ncbi:MAG: type 1 glutamine amidotransferase family protein, partial [Chitinophagaceae bacterium]